jgi:hypothetical protein
MGVNQSIKMIYGVKVSSSDLESYEVVEEITELAQEITGPLSLDIFGDWYSNKIQIFLYDKKTAHCLMSSDGDENYKLDSIVNLKDFVEKERPTINIGVFNQRKKLLEDNGLKIESDPPAWDWYLTSNYS